MSRSCRRCGVLGLYCGRIAFCKNLFGSFRLALKPPVQVRKFPNAFEEGMSENMLRGSGHTVHAYPRPSTHTCMRVGGVAFVTYPRQKHTHTHTRTYTFTHPHTHIASVGPYCMHVHRQARTHTCACSHTHFPPMPPQTPPSACEHDPALFRRLLVL